jgi:hypothetical protein
MKWFFLLFLSFTVNILSAQEKYALLISAIDSKTAAEKIISRNDIQLLAKVLSIQGFKNNNVTIDTSVADKNSFFSQISKITAALRRGDFVLLYFDMPLKNEPGKSDWLLEISNNPSQNISLTELTASLNTISKKLNDPNLFFSFFNSEMSAPADNLSFSKENLSINGLLACRPGEKKLYSNNVSLFIRSAANALTAESSYMTTYYDLLQRVETNMLLHTSRQHPALIYSGSKPALFNNRFIKSPVYFPVQSQTDNQTVVINAGQNINILPGTMVKFYPANSFDTAKKMVTQGIVTSSTEVTAVVKLTKPYADARQNLWSYIGWNDNDMAAINPLSFNTSFSQSGNAAKNKYFETIVKEIKEDVKLSKYIKFVSTGGDLQISDIGLMSKDSISCTVINPRTGGLVKDFFYSTKNDKLTYDNNNPGSHSDVEDYLIRTAEWQYLSQLHNPVQELQLDALLKYTTQKEMQSENGYPVVYENDELVLSLHNSGSKKIYFSILALRADKSSKLISPGLGESGSNFFILPGGTFISEAFTVNPPFGQEKLKIITSSEPVEPEELRQQNILTRKKENAGSFLPEYVNIQDFEYEIRNSLYAGNKSVKKTNVQTTVTGKKIQISNSSAEKVFFNVLQALDNGNYKTILPGISNPPVNCVVNPAGHSSFELAETPEGNTQLIYVFADRPFLLNQYESENKTINELLTDIIRNGRIPGSPLNKITLRQQLAPVENKTTTRGNDIMIKLVNPRLANERTTPLQALSREFIINGFAMTEDNKPVQSVKINGEPAEYDRNLKFFDKIIQLSGGKNKIVIEAADEKGFTAAQTFEVELQKTDLADTDVKGINYFLGIAVNNYKTWPPLFNAKNDIISFAGLMEQKFGYLSANTVLLIDTAATRRNIIRQIRSFLVKVKPNDNVIIYFSGHGNKDQLTDGDYYFIPSDGEADDVSSAVKSTDIIDNFKNIKAKNCLLIMDACFSGLISNSANRQISLGNANKNPADLPSKWIITSGRATKVSDGLPGTNSPFASVMINYLKDNTEQSKLTISKLIDYLKDNVPKFNKQQIPFGLSIAGEGELTFRIVN